MSASITIPDPEQTAERAVALFGGGYCCSEAVLLAFSELAGVRSDLIPAMATGFCGGLARTGNVCGAVCGAIMVIGLVTGRRTPTDSRQKNHALVRMLITQFEAKYGSIICRELTQIRRELAAAGNPATDTHPRMKCSDLVAEAARLATALLRDAPADKSQA